MELAGNSLNGAVVAACWTALVAVGPWKTMGDRASEGGAPDEEEEDMDGDAVRGGKQGNEEDTRSECSSPISTPGSP